jgi:hypothetical protein
MATMTEGSDDLDLQIVEKCNELIALKAQTARQRAEYATTQPRSARRRPQEAPQDLPNNKRV